MNINNNHTYYFIKYPLGSGGTHLANLISLSPDVNNKFLIDPGENYFDCLKLYYTKNIKTVHYDTHHIISDLESWTNYLDNLDYSIPNSVHLGHAASFDWTEDLLNQLVNKKYINIVFTTEKSIKFLRHRESIIFQSDTLRNSYYQKEIQHFYNKQFISKNPKHCNDDINLNVEFEDMCKLDISKVVYAIGNKYNIQIPMDQAMYLHKLWMGKQNFNDI